MSRSLRVQYPGAAYHVSCRGNDKKAVFHEDTDRQQFLKLLSQSQTIYQIKLYCYVLMANHFHLLVETPLGNLAEFMRHFNITYTSYYNRKYKRVGHLYQGRYKSVLVEKAAYLTVLTQYIHLNPIRIKSMNDKSLEAKVKYLHRYFWSSLPGYLDLSQQAPFIDYDLALEEYGGNTGKGRRGYKQAILEEVSQEGKLKQAVVGQSILGDEKFIAQITEKYLKKTRDRERPAHNQIIRKWSKTQIIAAIEKETGKNIETLIKEKGDMRAMAMELLYQMGGLRGREIGTIFGVDYSLVSQVRKRLREKLEKELKLKAVMDGVKRRCRQ